MIRTHRFTASHLLVTGKYSKFGEILTNLLPRSRTAALLLVLFAFNYSVISLLSLLSNVGFNCRGSLDVSQ